MYAIEQVGYAIFGTGTTRAAAKHAAREWLDGIGPAELQAISWNSNPADGELRLARITPEMAARVQAGAGRRYGTLPDGTLCTNEQEQAAYAKRA